MTSANRATSRPWPRSDTGSCARSRFRRICTKLRRRQPTCRTAEMAAKRWISALKPRAWLIRSFRRWWLLAAAVLTVCLVSTIWYLHRPLPPPRISRYTQITHDGHRKWLAGVDGSRLYFKRIYAEFHCTGCDRGRRDGTDPGSGARGAGCADGRFAGWVPSSYRYCRRRDAARSNLECPHSGRLISPSG